MTSSADGIQQITDVVGDTRDVADVVVIGTGAAGAVAARVLAEAGLDVVMIEEGPHVTPEAFRLDMWTTLKTLWRDAGFLVARGRAFLPILQGRAVGGSTIVNGAIVHRLPEAIHAQWAREHGADDVLSMAALARAWDRLDDELSVAPGPDEILGANNDLMRTATDRVGIGGNVIRRNVVECTGAGRCLQGCPTGAKQSMDATYVPYALERGARLYATCRAERITSQGGRASGVAARFVDPLTGRLGPRLDVEARRAVVLAASAIQTPLLLTASGIGRASKLVGRRFQAHPGSSMLGVFDDPVDMWFGATQGYETTHYWDERMKFETVGMPLDIGGARLPGFGAPLVRRLADFGHIAHWGVQVRAEAQGRVRRGMFGRTVINYDMTDQDVAILKTGLKRVAELMFAAGARAVLPGIYGMDEEITSLDGMAKLDDLPDDPRLFHGIASHLFGTAVMGPDPRHSVVGTNLEAHDLPGLFVIDSSVFPTNMGVNPAHTISAVAWVASERIADT